MSARISKRDQDLKKLGDIKAHWDNLTDWEKNFINNCHRQVLCSRALSVDQNPIVERIFKQRVLA